MNQLFLFRKDMTPIRKLLLMHLAAGGKLIEESATGNPLSFTTNVAKPLRAFSMSMLPTQSGTGDPYPPGGGKNLFDFLEYGYYSPSQDKFMPTTTNATSKSVWMTQGTVVTISQSNMSNDYSFEEWSIEITETSQMKSNNLLARASNATGAGRTYTVQNDCYLTVRMGIVDQTLKQAQLMFEKGSSASPYQPYSNIRPISGWTGVTGWHTGKNLYDEQYTGIQETSTITYYPLYVGEGKFTISSTVGKTTGGGAVLFLLAGSVSTGANTSSNGVFDGQTRTVTSVGGYVTIAYRAYNGADPRTAQTMLNSGNSASTYEAYNGATVSVTFPALGKNLLNPATLEQGGISEAGAETVNSARVRTGYIPVEQGKSYTLSATGMTCFLHFYSANKENIGQNASGTNQTPPVGAAFVRGFFRNAGKTDISPSDITNPMFEQSSSATAYEPYTNTVYGGTLDLTTGVLTATWIGVDAKSLTWGGSSQAARQVYSAILEHNRNTNINDNIICDAYKTISSTVSINIMDDGIKGNANYSNIIYIRDSRCATVDDFKDNVDALIVYELATPQTFQLTPQQITALVGTNTMWSDVNGDCSVTYLKRG